MVALVPPSDVSPELAVGRRVDWVEKHTGSMNAGESSGSALWAGVGGCGVHVRLFERRLEVNGLGDGAELCVGAQFCSDEHCVGNASCTVDVGNAGGTGCVVNAGVNGRTGCVVNAGGNGGNGGIGGIGGMDGSCAGSGVPGSSVIWGKFRPDGCG